MTQHFRFVLSHYMNVLLILLRFNNCQNIFISASVSVAAVTGTAKGVVGVPSPCHPTGNERGMGKTSTCLCCLHNECNICK